MKKIFTSYYQRSGGNPNAVAISRTISSWVSNTDFCGEHRKDLAPSQWLLNMYKTNKISEDEYSEIYIEEIKRIGLTPHKIVDDLPDGAILLCYEKVGDFCHRRVLAEWIEDEIGFTIPEILTDREKASGQQMKMVDILLDF